MIIWSRHWGVPYIPNSKLAEKSKHKPERRATEGGANTQMLEDKEGDFKDIVWLLKYKKI